jgi:RNAse (barnase) inhibitor barstar
MKIKIFDHKNFDKIHDKFSDFIRLNIDCQTTAPLWDMYYGSMSRNRPIKLGIRVAVNSKSK